ncbi:MAG: oxygen-dependent coproporphyrinogen oxidase [Cyclobacteriaceae bacterium]|nr:oxygen-dependent coproporphyrinogen oxidase [Cyclobacteriaceae bacterium]
MVTKEEIAEWFKELQDNICAALENLDSGSKFREDIWNREGGGGGRTRIIEGNVIEKGGVNFSAVHGQTPQNILSALKLDEADFFATGVSIVLHPSNPNVPIIHMNVRYFEMSNGTWWFGGGIDLTPHVIEEDEARYFHKTLKSACDNHHPDYYHRFKEWADDYFYNKHRKETRGIGGIFFDRLSINEPLDKNQLFEFVKKVGNTFAPLYCTLAEKKKDLHYTEDDKQWQNLRRGRYVEFNLVYDKGTKFGLDTDGRVESILMSLPKTAGWEYNYVPKAGSREENTLKQLKKGINWI